MDPKAKLIPPKTILQLNFRISKFNYFKLEAVKGFNFLETSLQQPLI